MNWPVPGKRLLLVLTVVALFWPSAAFADSDSLRPYSSLVVQNRQNNPMHELTVGVGVLPLDAFTKGYTVSGGYTLHFTERWAWEVGQFHYSFHRDTDLKEELRALDVQPTPFELVEYYLTSSVMFKPLYWKGSWLNSSLTHGEIFFNLGGAYAWYTRSNRPGASVGTGARLYLSRHFSFRLDVRYLMFFDDKFLDSFDFKDEVSVGLGTSIGF
ncbi:MAG: outer membrane beta-barrel domain-containing protein [Bradymonadaceae bacterium]